MKRAIFSYTTEQLLPYIDWNYFFHAWGIGGSNAESDKAREVKQDAELLLQRHLHEETATALFTLCDAHSEGDNIIIENYSLPLLRQQHTRPGEPNICLSDFISPHNDKIGLFATSVKGIFATNYSGDTYESILTQTTASRLAEAAATLLHKEVRKNTLLWGYAPEERLTPQELKAEKQCGIRPAIGYPSLPDQSVIFILDSILQLCDIGIELTQNGAMRPAASVCGLMFSHPASRYFAVGRISNEQLLDYSQRRGITTEDLHKFLYKNIVS